MGKSKDLATGAAYQDQTESDTRYVNTAGDTMTGRLNISGASNTYATAPILQFNTTYTNTDNRNWAIGPADDSYGNFHIFRSQSQSDSDPVDNDGRTITITKDGHVTMPSQPHIYGTVGNTGGEGSSGAGFCNRMYVQTSGGNMTFSNSRITVPVAGVYMVAWQTLTNQSGSGRYDTAIHLNGSNISSGLNNASDASGDYRMRTHIFARDLAANDYLQFNHDHPYATGAAFDIWSNVSVFLLG